MDLEKGLEKALNLRKMERCNVCNFKLRYEGLGKYICDNCGAEVLDEYGKLRTFLEEHGPTSEAILAQQTGISMNKIDNYLRKGTVEIPNGERFYLQCESCGCDIRYGRYCPECVKRQMKDSYKTNYQDIGEKPKSTYKSNMSGKMHFINRRGN